MTTISGYSNFLLPQRQMSSAHSGTGSDFAAQYDSMAAQPDEGNADRIDELQAELDELESRQLELSNRDYLFAKFTLLDQMATEKLQSGEDIDTLGIRFEGQVFHIAGTRLRFDLSQAVLPESEMVKPSKLQGYSSI